MLPRRDEAVLRKGVKKLRRRFSLRVERNELEPGLKRKKQDYLLPLQNNRQEKKQEIGRGMPENLLICDFEELTVHCTENPIYLFTEKKLLGLDPNSYVHVSVSD